MSTAMLHAGGRRLPVTSSGPPRAASLAAAGRRTARRSAAAATATAAVGPRLLAAPARPAQRRGVRARSSGASGSIEYAAAAPTFEAADGEEVLAVPHIRGVLKPRCAHASQPGSARTRGLCLPVAMVL